MICASLAVERKSAQPARAACATQLTLSRLALAEERGGPAPSPLQGGRSPARAGAPPLYRRAETEEASEPSARRLRSTGELRRNLSPAGGEDRSNSVGAR